MPEVVVVRGVPIRYISAREVRPGAEIACWLSDAAAYVWVTGSTERELQLSRYGLPNVTHITFTTEPRPWWVDDGFVTFADDRRVPIRDVTG